jgi:hypothetical protein
MNRHSTIARLGPVLGSLLALAAFGCGDKGMPTQPLTPTPRPTPASSTVSMEVTLSRTDPPAGVPYAARAAVTLHEKGGHAVRLTGMKASSYYGLVEMRVLGFAPIDLAAGGTASFTVTVTTQSHVSCTEEVDFEILAIGQESALKSVGCENSDWPL